MALIRAKIGATVSSTYWFMEQVLYHPDFGYYSTGQCQIGRRGDYFTNVSVGPLFGRILAAQFAEIWEVMGRPGDFTLVEQGAHHGDFAKDVLEAARERTPDFFAALRYCIVEPFPMLQARQIETLRDLEGRVTWKDSLTDLSPFSGVHFSNELLDSMPVHLICREGEADWREKFVAEGSDEFVFVVGEIQDERLRRKVSAIPNWGNGHYETEVKWRRWIGSGVSRNSRRGFVLAVDYGFLLVQIFIPRAGMPAPAKLFRAPDVDSPFTDIGRCDLTAHVDGRALSSTRKSGLRLAGFTDQHHFITGILALLDVQKRSAARCRP